MRPQHEFREHTSETELVVRAATFEELLEEAARALGAIQRRSRVGEPEDRWREITVHAPDRQALLVEWLNELVFLGERHRWIPLEAEILAAREGELHARARGVVLAQPPSLVKAATLHGLRLEPVAGGAGLEASVLLDV